MNKLLRIESIALFLTSLYLYFYLYQFNWVYFVLFLLLPDISMLGYLINSAVGAYTYNSVHNLVLPVILFFVGTFTGISVFLMSSLILFAHIYMDRSLGYGLKYTDSFHHTHLTLCVSTRSIQ